MNYPQYPLLPGALISSVTGLLHYKIMAPNIQEYLSLRTLSLTRLIGNMKIMLNGTCNKIYLVVLSEVFLKCKYLIKRNKKWPIFLHDVIQLLNHIKWRPN